MTKALSLILFLHFLLIGASFAQDDGVEPSWQIKSVTLVAGNVGWKQNFGDQPYKFDFIYAENGARPGDVAIACMNGSLMAAVSTDDRPISETLPGLWSPLKVKQIWADVEIDGEKVKGNVRNWSYSKKQDIIIPRNKLVTKKIYNAVIRKQTGVIKKTGVAGDIFLTLPKPNMIFADFGAECGVGRNASN